MILGIIQARVSSSRLPGKVLKPIIGRQLLACVIERILRSRKIDEIIVATSRAREDDAIERLCRECRTACFRGGLNDVLDRFYQAAKPHKPEHVVRLTGDCPLIDPAVIDATIDFYLRGGYDYVSNCQPPYTFPDGLDTEVFRFSALEAAWEEAMLPSEREHITPFIRKHHERFTVGHYMSTVPLGHLRWTVDEPEDFEFVSRVYNALYPSNPAFTMDDVLKFLKRDPALIKINSHIRRNEGTQKSLQADKIFLAQHV